MLVSFGFYVCGSVLFWCLLNPFEMTVAGCIQMERHPPSSGRIECNLWPTCSSLQKCCCKNSISAAASWPQGMVASSSFARCLRPIWMANTWFLEVWLKAGHLLKLHHGLLDLAFSSGFSWFYASTEPELDLPTNFADGFGHKLWCSPFASVEKVGQKPSMFWTPLTQ